MNEGGSGLAFRREAGGLGDTDVARVTDVPGIPITVRRRTQHMTAGFRQPNITTQLTFRLPSPRPRFLLLRATTPFS